MHRPTAPSPPTPVTVRTPDGPVVGELSTEPGQTPLARFRSIPYAAPASGVWRWQGPRAPIPWEQPRDVRRPGPVSPQPYGTGYTGYLTQPPQSPACHTLWVTAPVGQDEPLPVLVYLHGGAFTSGGGDEQEGTALARRGPCIFVSFNYRLGALGWMHFDDFSSPEQPIHHNLGLRDMIAALQWVQRCIHAFGGDPDRVTVLGESAGAMALTTLLATPSAAGLFSRAIVQSTAPAIMPSLERAHGWAHELLEVLGLDPNDRAATNRALAAISDRELVRGLTRLNAKGLSTDAGAMPVVPAWGGDLVPQDPYDTLRNGQGLPVPLLIGTNADEATLFAYFGALSSVARATWHQMVTAERRLATGEIGVPQGLQDMVPQVRDADLNASQRRARSLKFGTEAVFWAPTQAIAAAHSAVAPVWVYRYDHATALLEAIGMGATHAIELLHVFDEREPIQAAATAFGSRADFDRLTATIQRHWLGFIRDGDPGGGWPRYTPAGRWTKIFDTHDRLVSDPDRQRRHFWEELDLRP